MRRLALFKGLLYLFTTIFVRSRSTPVAPGVVWKLICGFGCDVTDGESTGITVVPSEVVMCFALPFVALAVDASEPNACVFEVLPTRAGDIITGLSERVVSGPTAEIPVIA